MQICVIWSCALEQESDLKSRNETNVISYPLSSANSLFWCSGRWPKRERKRTPLPAITISLSTLINAKSIDFWEKKKPVVVDRIWNQLRLSEEITIPQEVWTMITEY